MKQTSALAAVLASSALLVGASVAAAAPSITLSSASANAKGVSVAVSISDFALYPALVGKAPKAGGGHFHVYLNGKYVGAAAGRSGMALTKDIRKAGFKAGSKVKVTVQLAQNNHGPVGKASASKLVTLK